MTIDSGYRTVHSGAHAALVGVEVLVLDADERVHAGIAQLLSEAQPARHLRRPTPSARSQLVERQFFSVALDRHRHAVAARRHRDDQRRSSSARRRRWSIALTPRRSYDDAVDAVRAGAVDLILKAPESVAYLKERVLDAAGRSVGKREVDSVLDEVAGSTRSSSSASWRPSGARSISPTRPPAAIQSRMIAARRAARARRRRGR